jgi:membrane fusion protein (multidrug efflux system)
VLKIIFLIIFLYSCLYPSNIRAIIVSLDRTTISSEISGKVIKLSKENGDYFKKNELLLEIDCKLYEAQKDKINIEKNIALLELQNHEKLAKLKSNSQLQLEQAKAKYEKQNTEYKIAQINVDRCKIYAPFNGRIINKKVSKYQIVKAQEELFDILGNNNLEAIAIIPSKFISKLRKSQKVSLHIDEIDKTIKATIKEFSATIDTSSQTINVRLKLDNKYNNILSGMSGTVYIK